MKKSFVVAVSALALFCALAVPTITRSVARASQPAVAPVASPVPAAVPAPGAVPEPHPEMRAAIGALENAKRHLEHASHDFEGHRAKALEHTNQALEECRLALASDRR